jgi:hypothetical protein
MLLVVHVCQTADIPFEGAHALNRSSKRKILEWIGENWDTLGETVTTIAANPRTMSGRHVADLRKAKDQETKSKGHLGL